MPKDRKLPRLPVTSLPEIAAQSAQFGLATGLACAGIPWVSPAAGFVSGAMAGTYAGILGTENLVMAGIFGLAAGGAGAAVAVALPGTLSLAWPIGLASTPLCGATLLTEQALKNRDN